ncbi:hypothetical protein P7C73_g4894, partial [Tremellales sp. Uapishka_1]
MNHSKYSTVDSNTQLSPYPPPPLTPPPESQVKSISKKQKKHHGIMDETEDELTEDEQRAYDEGLLSWDKAKNWRFWFRREWLWWYVLLVIIIVVVGLMAIFHRRIIDWMAPFVRKLRNLKAGYLIPAAIIFVLSFPPLFGAEIVHILAGLVWGLGVGFAIVAVGTLLGEIANYMWLSPCETVQVLVPEPSASDDAKVAQLRLPQSRHCRRRLLHGMDMPAVGHTHPRNNGGLRGLRHDVPQLSPSGHLEYAQTADRAYMWSASPVGVVLGQTTPSHNSRTISDSVFAVTAVVTLGCLWYIHHRMMKVRKRVILGMRKDLQSKNVKMTPAEMSFEAEEQGVNGANGGIGRGSRF